MANSLENCIMGNPSGFIKEINGSNFPYDDLYTNKLSSKLKSKETHGLFHVIKCDTRSALDQQVEIIDRQRYRAEQMRDDDLGRITKSYENPFIFGSVDRLNGNHSDDPFIGDDPIGDRASYRMQISDIQRLKSNGSVLVCDFSNLHPEDTEIRNVQLDFKITEFNLHYFEMSCIPEDNFKVLAFKKVTQVKELFKKTSMGQGFVVCRFGQLIKIKIHMGYKKRGGVKTLMRTHFTKFWNCFNDADSAMDMAIRLHKAEGHCIDHMHCVFLDVQENYLRIMEGRGGLSVITNAGGMGMQRYYTNMARHRHYVETADLIPFDISFLLRPESPKEEKASFEGFDPNSYFDNYQRGGYPSEIAYDGLFMEEGESPLTFSLKLDAYHEYHERPIRNELHMLNEDVVSVIFEFLFPRYIKYSLYSLHDF